MWSDVAQRLLQGAFTACGMHRRSHCGMSACWLPAGSCLDPAAGLSLCQEGAGQGRPTQLRMPAIKRSNRHHCSCQRAAAASQHAQHPSQHC